MLRGHGFAQKCPGHLHARWWCLPSAGMLIQKVRVEYRLRGSMRAGWGRGRPRPPQHGQAGAAHGPYWAVMLVERRSMLGGQELVDELQFLC